MVGGCEIDCSGDIVRTAGEATLVCLLVLCSLLVCCGPAIAGDTPAKQASGVEAEAPDVVEEVTSLDITSAQQQDAGASDIEASDTIPLKQLSPLDQIRAITGLFTIVVLGLVMFIVIKAGSHMVQGMSAAANRLPQDSSPKRDDWAQKPLNEELSSQTEAGPENSSDPGHEL